MDGNKDEALRCVSIAEEAIASGNKERALKFIKIARRLDRDLSVDELLAKCETLEFDSSSPFSVNLVSDRSIGKDDGGGRGSNDGKNYSEEHVQLIRQIKGSDDYYVILGLKKTCSIEEIRRAYRKLSLKVHPDKNKAPGSEEAFKKVSKAFKCLSDQSSRRQYDQTGLVEEFEYNQQNTFRRRRRTTDYDLFDDNFDPDEIFRTFFGQTNMYRAANVNMTRGMGNQRRQEFHGGGLNIVFLLQIILFLSILLLVCVPFSEPEYSLYKKYSHQIPKTIEKHGVEFYVKSSAFDDKFPLGSHGRAEIENSVIKDYKGLLRRYCHTELQRRHWNRNLPTPHCVKLHNLGEA